MHVRRLVAFLFAAWASAALAAPAVVISPGPDKVSVTIYRSPDRDGALNLDGLTGFALITETRTVTLPRGPATIRFEGVASGIVPQSALIFGGSIREKNRDAALLSQHGLLDAFTGQRVILRRTDRATGKVTEELATIRSGSDRLVVETAHGFEAMYCDGLAQTLIFPGVPATLSARPVLSMTTRNQPGGRTTITLAYLASRFDWQANYVAQLSADARSLDLFAWLTMASSDDTSFVNAQAAAVAGRVNRSDNGETENPVDRSDLDKTYGCRLAEVPPAQALAPPPMVAMRMAGAMMKENDIVVTAARVATLENLGDLKLYRIPMPVTVAARAQKQVAFLVKPKVRGSIVYRVRQSESLTRPEMLFRFKNAKASGLGEPLPSGQVALFQQSPFGRTLVGQARIEDKTIDEDVDLVFGHASNVTSELQQDRVGRGWIGARLTVRNANPFPVSFEAEFPTDGESDVFSGFSAALAARPGKHVWVVTVPANGTAQLAWRQTRQT